MEFGRHFRALTGALFLITAFSGCSRVYLGSTTAEELKLGVLEKVVVTPDGDGAIRLEESGLMTGADTAGDFNKAGYHYGIWTSPFEDTIKFDEAIPSWEAVTPPGTWIRIEARVKYAEKFTPWYNLGVWASSDESVTRHSVAGQRDRFAQVLTDTLKLSKVTNQVQYRVTLFTEQPGVSPVLRAVGLDLTHTGAKLEDMESDKVVWGERIDVPARTQWEGEEGKELAAAASVSMVLGYYAAAERQPDWDRPVDEVADGVFDATAGHYFNLSFNAAYASSLGLSGRVSRFEALGQLERYLELEVPVVMVLAYDEGDLPGAPLPAAEHHAVVLKGFTSSGEAIVNDPGAKSEGDVERIYPRKQLEAAWRATYGTTLLIHPPSWGPLEQKLGEQDKPEAAPKSGEPAKPEAAPKTGN